MLLRKDPIFREADDNKVLNQENIQAAHPRVLLIENAPSLIRKHNGLLDSLGFIIDIASTKTQLNGLSEKEYCAIFTCLEKKGFKAWLGARVYFYRKDGTGPKIFLYLAKDEAKAFRSYFLKQQTDYIFELPLSIEQIKPVLDSYFPVSDVSSHRQED